MSNFRSMNRNINKTSDNNRVVKRNITQSKNINHNTVSDDSKYKTSTTATTENYCMLHVGPMGPCGPVGERGPQGYCGPVGSLGPQGPQGPQGRSVMGPRGNPGPIGPTGPEGKMGPEGKFGPKGPTGQRGPHGPIGPTGQRGNMGRIGHTGATGKTGPTGSQGDVGPRGPIGIQGPRGCAGINGSIGPTGAVGPAGNISTFAFNYELTDCVVINSSTTAQIVFDNPIVAEADFSLGEYNAPINGTYTFNANVQFSFVPNFLPANYIVLNLLKNGNIVNKTFKSIVNCISLSQQYEVYNLSYSLVLNVGDVIEIQIVNNSSGNITVERISNFQGFRLA